MEARFNCLGSPLAMKFVKHIKDALHAGESQQRLNLVAACREVTVFTEAERAALELAEQGTRIADAAIGAADETWANAAKHYDDDQLAALVAVVALVDAYNRMNVIVRQPTSDYHPGVRITIGQSRPADGITWGHQGLAGH